LKFIHTADIHLDSPLSGLAAYKDAPVELLRTVTRDAFTRLVDEAIDESVDFMVIAGDLYDGAWKDYNTGHFFCREMGRLNKVGIPVYLLFGNHDADSEMTKKLMLPANVHQFDARKATTFRIDALKVALHGRSYKEAATVENLATSYPAPVAGWLNIGVLHTALGGYADHANYAPCSVAELNAKGYDYWALGHVHEHVIVQQSPWVVFPGNLQGRHIKEQGARGAVMVTFDESGIQTVERLLVDSLRWHTVEVDASSATTLPDVVRLVGQSFEHLVIQTPDKLFLSVRVCIRGKTAAHGELFGLESQLREEILGQAAGQGIDRLWVEKVRIETEPVTGASETANHTDALAIFERIHQQLQKIRETRVNRVDMMRRDLDSFALAAKALARDIAPGLATDTPSQISLSLDAQLKQHAFASQELGRLKQELAQATIQVAAANEKQAQARASLEPLLRLSKTTSNDELRIAAANSDQLRTLTAEMGQALRQLLSAGDGLDRATLSAEWAATDADATATSLDEIKRQTDEVVELQSNLSSTLTSAAAVLGKIAGQSEAARAESQRQQALARMGNALERFIKVFTAAKLLRWSIEKFRETKQGPMLARASDVFAGLTQGAFSKLVVDYEHEPLKLSGQRTTGERVEIDGMSEGTRDQLYLALRLAALELHLEKTIALPFIADDLFINYDDGRASAGLQALAKLSESTQVIFLSHHAHLVPVAQSVFGDNLNVVHLS